jgi:hypothetical protein
MQPGNYASDFHSASQTKTAISHEYIQSIDTRSQIWFIRQSTSVTGRGKCSRTQQDISTITNRPKYEL